MSVSLEERQAALGRFLDRWPVSKLESLALEEYIGVGDNNTLAYWLEFGDGRHLGSIKGGDSSKFGVYERKAEAKGSRGFIRSDARYSWKSKYGESAEAAFVNIRQHMLTVIRAAQAGDLQSIEALDFEVALKWKLAFIYQNQQQPCALPIYTLEKLKLLLNPSSELTHASAYTELLAQRGDKSLLQYGEELWTRALQMQGENAVSDEYEETPVPEREDEPALVTAPALNQILYGPPGTGKTYETIRAALQILAPDAVATYDSACIAASTAEQHAARATLKAQFDELCSENRIQFVTFHQSFSYEDFVEGLRAESDENSGQLRYEVVDGVFKSLCLAASVKVVQQAEAPIDFKGRRIWKMSLGNTQGDDAGIYDECLAGGYALLGYGGKIDFQGCTTRADVIARFEAEGETLSNPKVDYSVTSVFAFVAKMKIGDLIVVSDGNFKFRAIGEIVGDYIARPHPDYDEDYSQCRKVKWLRSYEPSLPHTELMNNRFSQMTLYELHSGSINMDKLSGLLGTADKPISDSRVLIIDEINRGNVSRVFGELITLIEPSKRAGAAEALEVVLPYSKEKFSVPSNVYLIGTMNTADRSLSGLDIALRRRFHFREMPPRPELLGGLMVSGINIETLLGVMNERIEVLLDRDHRLGHAYFMPLHTNPQLECLAEIFRNQVLPLLQEYFFEDWQRICWVLNDHRKPKADQFVQQQSHDIPTLFGEGVSISDHVKSWLINSSAFDRPSAYLGVIPAPNLVLPATGEA